MSKNAIKVALIGNPNVGKTSVFNQLTGLNQQVGNYPGITVDKKTGICKLNQITKAKIIDFIFNNDFLISACSIIKSAPFVDFVLFVFPCFLSLA